MCVSFFSSLRAPALCGCLLTTLHPISTVMRADGVLRLILNVALFPGMSCERQDKWVRFSAFEDAQLSHLAVRAGSVKSAEELVSARLREKALPSSQDTH